MEHQSKHVIIGVDPHKLSATIEVVDQHEQLLGSGRFTTDRAGYAAMRSYAKTFYLSRHTVDVHLKHVYLKLDIHSRVELTVLALQHRLPIH